MSTRMGVRRAQSRTARVVIGALIAASGFGGLTLALAGNAGAATNPSGISGTIGSTVGNPVVAQVSVPTAITLTLAGSNVNFNQVLPGKSATGNVTSTVSSNDPAGYGVDVAGVNNAAAYLAANPNAVCNETMPNSVTSTSSGAAVSTYSLAATRPVSGGGGYLTSDGTPTGAELYYATNVSNGISQGNVVVANWMVGTTEKATDAAFNKGMTANECASSDPTNFTGSSAYNITDNFSEAVLPWAALSVSGGQTGGALAENDSEGTYTNTLADGTSTPYTLVTNPVQVDGKSSVSGTAGSTTATTDSLNDTLSLTVPGNQSAGAYTGYLDWIVFGN